MEAAKRARAEAAERGRIASREWAERNMKGKKKSVGVAGGAGAVGGIKQVEEKEQEDGGKPEDGDGNEMERQQTVTGGEDGDEEFRV